MHPKTVWTLVGMIALVAAAVGVTYGVMAPEVAAQQYPRWEYAVLSIYDIAPPVQDEAPGAPGEELEQDVAGTPADEPDIIEAAQTDRSGLERELNRLGAEGWELVASDEAMWILKRPL